MKIVLGKALLNEGEVFVVNVNRTIGKVTYDPLNDPYSLNFFNAHLNHVLSHQSLLFFKKETLAFRTFLMSAIRTLSLVGYTRHLIF